MHYIEKPADQNFEHFRVNQFQLTVEYITPSRSFRAVRQHATSGVLGWEHTPFPIESVQEKQKNMTQFEFYLLVKTNLFQKHSKNQSLISGDPTSDFNAPDATSDLSTFRSRSPAINTSNKSSILACSRAISASSEHVLAVSGMKHPEL